MPEIKWIGSPNFYPGRGGQKVFAIVNHVMCGSEGGTDTWFQNPKSQVSAHYGVAKDGSIHQYVKDSDTAWAVGQVNAPSWPLFSQTLGHPNRCTISIEHEGQPGDGLTEAQYQSTLWLHVKLIRENPLILPDALHIIGHNVLDTVNRKDCPGDKFPWKRLFADIDAALNPLPSDIHSGWSGFEADVEWAFRNKILGTYADGTIKPGQPTSREQFAHGIKQLYELIQKGAN